ncbi:MAG: diguanylate cyclase domain-containing protein, partial [Gammaproteobacteria bacterium]
GGEEFVLVLYGPPKEHAKTIPEQIRRDVMDLAIPHDGSTVDNVITVSVGVALSAPAAGRSLAGTIQIADEALYEAKRAGRNRLVCRDAEKYEIETGNFRVAARVPV